MIFFDDFERKVSVRGYFLLLFDLIEKLSRKTVWKLGPFSFFDRDPKSFL